MKLILGGILLAVLIVAWYVGFYVLPKASILVNAQTNRVRLEFDITLDKDAETDDLETRVLVPTTETLKKSFSESFPATGEANIGLKAEGKITLYNCYTKGAPLTLPIGTMLTSSDGNNYATTEKELISGGVGIGDDCDPGITPVNVEAVEPGTTSNDTVSLTYAVQGYTQADLYGKGSSITGGTDDIQKVVSQKDIDDAAEILGKSTHDEFIEELEAQFSTGFTPITTSFSVSEAEPKGEPGVGEAAEEVFVTLTYTYKMKGVSTDSMNSIIEATLVEELGNTLLIIYDNGLNDASMKYEKNEVLISANSFVGPELDADKLAEEVAGLRFSAAKNLLEDKDGVNSVEIELSPFWVFSLPNKDKIEVTIDIAEHALQETQ